MSAPARSHNDVTAQIARSLNRQRKRTFQLIEPLSYDDVHAQHDSIMSPLVWDVGHVGNFEEVWLLRRLAEREPHDPRLDEMYNPFDNPRWTRGDLPLLDREEATRYIDDVRSEALDVLHRIEPDLSNPLLVDWYIYRMVL